MAAGAEGEIIVVGDNDVLTVHHCHILDGEEGEAEAFRRSASAKIAALPCPAIRIKDRHKIDIAKLLDEAISIGGAEIDDVDPFELRRGGKTGRRLLAGGAGVTFGIMAFALALVRIGVTQ